MPSRRLARCLICPLFLLAVAPGCQALHRYRPLPVLVRDAETKQPIPAADVRLSYPFAAPSLAPWDSSGTTGNDGIAHLRAAPYGQAGIMVMVTAQGYLFEGKALSVEAVQAIPQAHLFEAVTKRPPSMVVELYAEPRPAVELVVPSGYRGLVKAEIRAQEDMPCARGQRLFSYAVPPSGVVAVTGPALLGRIFATDFRARYADGTPLSRQAQGPEVGLWWLKHESGCHYFVVGTRTEFEGFVSADENRSGESRAAGSGKGGGRGRRNRGGNPPPVE